MNATIDHRPSRGCYQTGCHHPACIQANRDYARIWYRRRLRPDSVALRARVPVGPTRTHLQTILASSTLRVVSLATGVSQASLSRIANGRFRTISRPTRDAILTFAPANVASVKESSGTWDDAADLAHALADILDDRLAPWRRHAACRHPHITVDAFFAERGATTITPARAVCGRCPVTDHCLAYADDRHIQAGVWGGLSPDERRPSRRRAEVAS